MLALRKAEKGDGPAVDRAVRCLKESLLAAEAHDAVVEGALLGMAAAQAVKLGQKEAVQHLCSYSWSRLAQCGAREVAELAFAASKLDVGDERFFKCVAQYCDERPQSYTCLRDVALVAAALTRNSAKFDRVRAFRGLAVAALPHLQRSWKDGGSGPRDISEFLYSIAQMLSAQPLTGGQALHEVSVVAQALEAGCARVRPYLHKASAQDIAKIAGAVSTAWSLLPLLQDTCFRPCIVDVAQAMRFRHAEFNTQDLALMAVSFVKVDDVLDSVASDVLAEAVLRRLHDFSSKSLSLALYSSLRLHWGTNCTVAIAAELERRDLATFNVQDLSMAAQALAKLGDAGKMCLSLVANEAFNRQLKDFTVTDKALFLWALGKARVVHIALCRMIIRDLAFEDPESLSREVASASLWGLGLIWKSLWETDRWAQRLLSALCTARPWISAPPYEVANAAWALGQAILPEGEAAVTWQSLLSTAQEIGFGGFPLHELCNLLSGLASCPQGVDGASVFMAHLAQEGCRLLRAGERLSAFDQRSLELAVANVARPVPPELAELADCAKISIDGHALSGSRAEDGEQTARGSRPRCPSDECSIAACATRGTTQHRFCDTYRCESDAEVDILARVLESGSSLDPAIGVHSGVSAAPPGANKGREITDRTGWQMIPHRAGDHRQDISSVAGPDVAAGVGSSGGGGGGGRVLKLKQLLEWHHPVWCDHRPQHGHSIHQGLPHDGLSGLGNGQLYSPDASPRRCNHAMDDEDDEAPDPEPTGGQHGVHNRCTECHASCCPEISEGSGDKPMVLNGHCDFKGHCLMLKHTFIHIDCTGLDGDGADCSICSMSRRRARSVGSSPMIRPQFGQPDENVNELPEFDELPTVEEWPKFKELPMFQ